MNKLMEEHRKLYGGFEVIVFVDTDKIEALRKETSHDVPVTVNWTWEYGSEVAELRRLYEKGKVNQWNAETDVDWDVPVSKDEWLIDGQYSLMAMLCKMAGLDEATQKAAAFDEVAYLLSQLLHGEQAALQLCGQLTNVCDKMDQKLYAASQVIDEARHIEVLAKFLERKMGKIYPVSPSLKILLDELLAVDGVQKKTLGMQTLFEGTAVGIMDDMRKAATNPLLNDMIRRVEQDETRHAAFGVLCMRRVVEDAAPEQMEEMEDWAFGILEAVQSSQTVQVLRVLGPQYGLDAEELTPMLLADPAYKELAASMFMHTVVPNLRRLGLLTERTEDRWREVGMVTGQVPEMPRESV